MKGRTSLPAGFTYVVFAQLFTWLGCLTASAQFIPYLPSSTFFEVPQEYRQEEIKEKVLKRLANENNKNLHSGFAEEIAAAPEYYLRTGSAYELWPEYETLLEDYARRYLSALDVSSDVEVMILRDPDINAYATAAGYMFFNIGILAAAESEEELLLVLGHELGHNLHDHAWDGFVDLKRAQNQVLVASLFGTTAYFLTRTFAISEYQRHSREDETMADEVAKELMLKSNFSLAKGAAVYHRFSVLEMNQMIKYGLGTGHWFYGSSHPDSKARYEMMMAVAEPTAETEPSKEFIALRNKARYETLHLLISSGRYRDAIERGWGFLLSNPNDAQMRAIVFDALRRLVLVDPGYYNNHTVLTFGYFADREVLADIQQNQLSEGAKAYTQAILLTDLSLDNSPFPLNITFRQLYDQLKSEVSASPGVEALLLMATCSSSPSESLLKTYIERKGLHSDYARLLLDRDRVVADSSLMIPSRLNLNESGFLPARDYTSMMNYYDWDPIRGQMKKDGRHLGIQRKDDYARITPYDWEMMGRMEEFAQRMATNEVAPINLLVIDPEVGKYLMSNYIDEVFIFNLYQSGNSFVQSELYKIDMGTVPSIEMNSGIVIGFSGGKSYLYNQFMKRYRRLN